MSDPETLPEFFMQRHGAADPATRADAIRAAVTTGFGNWLSPFGGNAHQRPATHMHEIDLFGITATGDTTDRAVANWFTVADRILTPQVAA